MVDPQTWLWVFSTIAHVYGILLGLFVIMITFVINLLVRVMEKTGVNEDKDKEVFKELRWFSKWALILTGIPLSISILMLSLGNSVNYHPVLLWTSGVFLPIIVIAVLLLLVYKLIEAIMRGLAGDTKPEKQIVMPKERRKLPRQLLCASIILIIFFSALLSYSLASHINTFFEGVLGEEAQAKFEAPIVEELLKPLGLIILVFVLWWASRIKPARVGWLKSMKFYYLIGYASGLIFGLLENWLSYGNFSGFRAATPFLHALETSIVGLGIYYIATKGMRGLYRLIPLYFVAFLLHFAWNNGSVAVRYVLGGPVSLVGLATFILLLGFLKTRGLSTRLFSIYLCIRGRRSLPIGKNEKSTH